MCEGIDERGWQQPDGKRTREKGVWKGRTEQTEVPGAVWLQTYAHASRPGGGWGNLTCDGILHHRHRHTGACARIATDVQPPRRCRGHRLRRNPPQGRWSVRQGPRREGGRALGVVPLTRGVQLVSAGTRSFSRPAAARVPARLQDLALAQPRVPDQQHVDVATYGHAVGRAHILSNAAEKRQQQAGLRR